MMLWYKAWRESRARFLLIALFMVSYCALSVFTQKGRNSVPMGGGSTPGMSYATYLYTSIYGKAAFGFLLFVPALLSMGGLLRERGRGTSVLSLSLPVGRPKLVGTRAAVGLLQIAALALIPAILLPALSPIVGESYPVLAALHFSVLWIVCCSVFFGMAFLFSALLSGEYTALVASLIAAISYEYVLARLQPNDPRFNVAAIMLGVNAQPSGFVAAGLPDPFPWITLLVIALVTVALLIVATRITQAQDF